MLGSAGVVQPQVGMLLEWCLGLIPEPPFPWWRCLYLVHLIHGLRELKVWALVEIILDHRPLVWLSFPDALVSSLRSYPARMEVSSVLLVR